MSLFLASIAHNGTRTNIDFPSNPLNAIPLIIVLYVTLGLSRSRHDSAKEEILSSFVKVTLVVPNS